MKRNDSLAGHFSAITKATSICLVLLCLPVTLLTQPSQLPPGFERVGTEDGLSQGFIGAIFQDSKGYMWFGTRDGLNRYDGYNFTIYRHNPFDSTTISGNWVTAICEDYLGNLWIGTQTGLNFFDPQTETFVRIPSAPEHPDGLYDGDVHSIVAAQTAPKDSILVLWIGTGKALNRMVLPVPITPQSLADELRLRLAKHMTHFGSPANDGTAWPVNEILLDRTNHLWFIIMNGDLFRAPAQAAGSLQFQRVTERFRTVQNIESVKITQDKRGVVWVVTGVGLARIDPDDPSLQRVRYYKHADAVEPLASGLSKQFYFNALAIDTKGRVWTTSEAGIYIFDPVAETFESLTKKLANSIEQPERFIGKLFATANGVVWIGSPGFGLLKYDLKKERFHTLTRTNVTTAFSRTLYVSQFGQTPEGEVLVNQQFRVEQEQDALVPYREATVKDAGTMLRAPSGDVWIATARELFHLPPGQRQPKKIFDDPERETRLFVVADNGLWFINGKWGIGSVLRDAQLYHHHPASGSIASYPIILPPATSDIFGIKSGTLDAQGRLWVAAQNGLLRIAPATKETKVYRSDPRNPQSLNQNFVKSILVDPMLPERYLWIGTEGGGLNRIDLTNESFRHYLEDDGLPSRTVYGVLADDDGNLWMSTNRGISKAILDRQSRDLIRFRNYFARDGLQGDEFNTNAFLKNKKGEMFFGGVNGLTWFHPDSVWDNRVPPPVVITNFYLHGKPVSHKTPRSPLQYVINTTDKILLPYHDNVLAFEFASLDFSNPRNNLYSYKMENYDADWSVPHTARRVTYSQMPPGEYVFRVRGSNSDGVWNEQGALINIIIMPPWWRTWWAYSLYVGFVALTLYGLRRYEKARQQLRHEAELHRVETEKLQEVDHLKSRFFANISHEFRTPLTLIMGQIDSELDSPNERKNLNKLHVASRNAKKLLALINQLLDLSKFEAGQMTLSASQQNIVPLLKHLVSSFESWAAQKKIALQFETSHDEILLWYEQDKIEKVMYNLLSNALKFTPEGGRVGVQLSVISEQGAEGGGLRAEGKNSSPSALGPQRSALVSVRDSGIGIPHDRLPHIFDRFFQVDSSQTREFEGTGIGLALVQELVQIHGGGISVQSTEGFGTTFVVSLPLGNAHLKPEQLEQGAKGKKQAGKDRERVSGKLQVASEQAFTPSIQQSIDPAIQEQATSIEQPATSDQQPATSSDFVLIVEDNADMRAFISEGLQDGYRIVEAANGEEGFVKAQEYIPDLIITDVMMPRVDGYEMTRRIRQDQITCHIPIIMLTAKATDEDKFEGLEQGVDAYLTKPFNKRELDIRVRKLIERHRQLRQRAGAKAVLSPSEIEASSMDQEFLQRVQESIEQNMENEDFSVDDLAGQIGVGKRQLQRKLKALTDSSPQQCIRTMRLQRARQLLEQGAGTISEIALRVGYSEGSALARAFREEFGFAPSEIKSTKEK